ncbi:MAG: OmpA family protein [Blastocatellia bacterium]|nr:OmpA family protein [Blastocatellia bacterium]
MKYTTVQRAIGSFLTALIVALGVSAQVDVARRTTAVTYPLDQQVMLQFRGTTRFPRMKGDAKVKRTSRNGTEVEVSVSKMPRPFELGAGYATYVLWAVSPDGTVDNLGEIKRRGFFEFDSKISVTTPLQTFALMITAEPHFLVRRPSQTIMLENLNPYTLSGRTVATTSTVQYFGNSSDYFRDPRTPEIAELDYSKTPSTILQAKQAIALARFAGADRDAATELTEAETLLQNAENAWRAGRQEEQVDITARQAISTAVKAENTAVVRKAAREKRNEQSRADAESRRNEEKFTDVQNQLADVRDELARERRSRELAERDGQNYLNQIRELRDENGRLREELGRIKVEIENVRLKAEQAEAAKQAESEARAKEAKIAKLKANETQLMTALKKYGVVSKMENAIVLVLPESYWQAARSSTFAMQSDGKLTAIAELLANNPDYTVTIESHTDDTGTAAALETLTETRAQRIAEKFESLGVAEDRIKAKGYGGTIPAVPNATGAKKAQNRRVNIILDLNVR